MPPSRSGALTAAALVLATGCGPRPEEPPASPASTPPPAAAAGSAPAPRSAGAPEVGDPGSLAVVVNKRRPLVPARWVPPVLEDVEGRALRPEAARAARELLAAARADGVGVVLLSGYRSYDEQAATYAGWVARQGTAAADTASARPGHSEHQTGLAVDVGEGTACDLQVCFAQTATAAWVAEHGPRYGFVVRYPWGEQATTGYWYEPWHLRYLGPERAQALVRSGAATLEEFSGLGPAPDYGADAPHG